MKGPPRAGAQLCPRPAPEPPGEEGGRERGVREPWQGMVVGARTWCTTRCTA